jgi:hypothetical protein
VERSSPKHDLNEGKWEVVGRRFDSSTRAWGGRASGGARCDDSREGGVTARCWRRETKAAGPDWAEGRWDLGRLQREKMQAKRSGLN